MHASTVVAPEVLSGPVGVELGPLTGVSTYIVVEAVYLVVALSNVHYNIYTYICNVLYNILFNMYIKCSITIHHTRHALKVCIYTRFYLGTSFLGERW